jgi:dUTP pyrophosphatase
MSYTINEVPIDIRLFRDGAQVPSHADDGSAGYDVYAWIDITDRTYGIKIEPHTTEVIYTGINLRIPRGWQILVLPTRSGMAFNADVTIINSPGLIDSSYDSDFEDFEINVGLRNHGDEQFVVKHGDRIAQILLFPAYYMKFNVVTTDNINRPIKSRSGGFGSTGK